jgi:dTDP-4-dehydrorhamnose reductase
MEKIWVTGSRGQLGTELHLQHAKLPGCSFIFTDIEELDLLQKKQVQKFFQKEKPDYIINCAAYTAVDKAEEEPEKAFLLNYGIPAHLAELTATNDCRVIHMSTDYVFDGSKQQPYTENDTPNPQSVYAKSKYAGEMEILKNAGNLIIRTSWLYSIHGQNFMKTVLKLGKEKDEIAMVNDQIGTPTSAVDLSGAILYVLNQLIFKKMNIGGIYHYSNEGQCSWFEFASKIVQFTGSRCTVKPILTEEYPLPAKRPSYSVMDKSKIRNDFSISIPDWVTSLEICLKQLPAEMR